MTPSHSLLLTEPAGLPRSHADKAADVALYNRRGDLTGNTITVEVLTSDLAWWFGRNDFWVGERAVIERRNGRLVACHGCYFGGMSIESAARTYANRGATYVAAVSK